MNLNTSESMNLPAHTTANDMTMTPPTGLEVGYVPIVTRQELADANNK